MSNELITKFANDAVKQLVKIQPHCPLLENVTFEVSIEDETLALINFNGEDLFMEVHTSEKASIARKVKVPAYVPGYYKHHYGGYWNPPEVEDVAIGEYDNMLAAVSEYVALDWINRTSDALEAESFADAGDIFEESA